MALTVFLIATLSLASYLYCWNDVRRGRPHILSLRQVTLIMDREALNRLFGAPGPGYRYVLSAENVAAIARSRRVYVYSEIALDAICMLAAWSVVTHQALPALEDWLVLLAGLAQAINLAYSMWLIRKWGWQIREEIEDIGD